VPNPCPNVGIRGRMINRTQASNRRSKATSRQVGPSPTFPFQPQTLANDAEERDRASRVLGRKLETFIEVAREEVKKGA
jgi:hypothetical protein